MKLTEITITRTIPASADKIFDVWIDSKSPGGPWFGCEQVILNPVTDGLFYHAVKHEGRIWAHYGRFLKVNRPRGIEHTWMSEATKGLESVVAITFEPRGAETNVTLRHSGLPDDDLGRSHRDGWTWMLNTIAERFGAR